MEEADDGKRKRPATRRGGRRRRGKGVAGHEEERPVRERRRGKGIRWPARESEQASGASERADKVEG